MALLRLTVRGRDRFERDVLADCTRLATIGDLVDALALPPDRPVARVARDGATAALDRRAMISASGLCDADVILLEPGATSHSASAGSGWVLRVVDGPLAGLVVTVPDGVSTLGRRATSAIHLDEPEISRAHAQMHAGAGGLEVEDLGSSNGTWVDGRKITGREGLRPGSTLQMGATTLVVEGDGAPAALQRDGEGGLLVTREPARREAPSPLEVEFPSPPARPEPRRALGIGLLVPLVAGVAFAAVTRQVNYLAMTLVSPLGLAITALLDRRGERGRAGRALSEYATERDQAERRLSDALEGHRRWLETAYPSGAECSRLAAAPSVRVWERSPQHGVDFLHLRIGAGPVETPVVARVPRGVDRPATDLKNAPLTVDLAAEHVVGLAGAPDAVHGLARSLLVQLATLHSPDDLRITVLVADGAELAGWAYARWFPHTWISETSESSVVGDPSGVDAKVEELLRLTDLRLAAAGPGRDGQDPLPRHVVVLAGAGALRQQPRVAELLERGPRVGIHAIVVDDDERRLPEEKRVTIVVRSGAPGSTLVVRRPMSTLAEGTADSLDAGAALAAARALGPLRRIGGSAAGAGIPTDARFLDLIGGMPAAEGIADSWTSRPQGTGAVPVGIGADGKPFFIDLVHGGPHALLAGMSGSGKSVFLKTWAISIALHNPPSALTFMFIEYKGQAAFRELAQLPHCVGSINNLDVGRAVRALRMLQFELVRRQKAFADAGVEQLTAYRSARAARPDLEPVARLLVVVDEFAELKEHLPDFITELVSIARIGRSLGVHLILATQRVSGAVSADISANVGISVSLRQASVEDSYTMVGSKLAFELPHQIKGRGYVKVGDVSPELFQTARADVESERLDRSPIIVRDWDRALPDIALEVRPAATLDGRTELDRLVAVLAEASEFTGDKPHGRPVTEPLPGTVDLASLAEEPFAAMVAAGGPVVGLYDDMAHQRHESFRLPLLEGHVAIVGGSRSGRSTTLRTVAAALCRASAPDQVHLHVVDAGHHLQALRILPQAGTVVSLEDARSALLIERLAREIEARLKLLQRAGLSSVSEQWALGQSARLPFIVLLIDGLPEVWAAFDNTSTGTTLDRILTQGPAAGISVLGAGDETMAGYRFGRRFSAFLLHRVSKAVLDLSALGIPRDADVHDLPQGRAYASPGGMEVQVALPGGSRETAVQQNHLRGLAERAARLPMSSGAGPLRLRSLPDEILVADLPAAAGSGGVPIGVGGDDAAPVELPAASLPLLVVGPGGSGRSTALSRCLEEWTRQGHPVLVVAEGGSLLHAAASSLIQAGRQVRLVDAAKIDALTEALASRPDWFVVADDIDRLEETARDALWAGSRGRPLAVSTRLLTLLPAAIRQLAESGTVLLLTPPDRYAAEAVGVKLHPSQCFTEPAGRGYLARRGDALLVQVAR